MSIAEIKKSGGTRADKDFRSNLVTAARTIRDNPESIEKTYRSGQLKKLPGMNGPAYELLVEYIETGTIKLYEELKSEYDEQHLEKIENIIAEHGGEILETNVQCYDINQFLINNQTHNIDFISLDTEGGELKILKAIDLDLIKIKAVVIENNYSTNEILHYMQSKGFYRVAYLSKDEIYINPIAYGKFKTTMIKVKLKFNRIISFLNSRN